MATASVAMSRVSCGDFCVRPVVDWEHVLVEIHDRVHAAPVVVLVVDPGREETRRASDGEGYGAKALKILVNVRDDTS